MIESALVMGAIILVAGAWAAAGWKAALVAGAIALVIGGSISDENKADEARRNWVEYWRKGGPNGKGK